MVAAVDSRTKPVAALQRLGANGLTVISPTMSATEIGDTSNQFLQIAASTETEAELVHHYTTVVLKKAKLVNYFTYGNQPFDPENRDLYVGSLDSHLAKTFARSGHYEHHLWLSGATLTGACGDDTVVFFGGRYSQLGDFLSRLHDDCNGRLPAVVADGSAARYMANLDDRINAPTNLPVAFIASGYLGNCSLIAETGLAAAKRHTERQNYLLDVGGGCGTSPADQDAGWGPMTYDATRVLIHATQESAAISIAPARKRRWPVGLIQSSTLHDHIRQWTKEHPYEGVTGPITFGPDQGGVAIDRYLALLCAPIVQNLYRPGVALPQAVDSVGLAYGSDPATLGVACS